MKKPEKSEIRISIVPRLDTTEWEFGRQFLQILCNADARLMPERVGNSEPMKIAVVDIEDCEKYWAPSAVIDGPLGQTRVKWNFFWRRIKVIKYWGAVFHTLTNKFNEVRLGFITLSVDPYKKMDWSELFHQLCIFAKPKFATMHFFTEIETRRGAFCQEAVDNFGVNDFIYGVPDVALKERGLSNLSWATFFGEQYAAEVDVVKLQANGFNVEPIGDGFLVTLTPDLFDVMDNFAEFSARRVALRKLFRPGLFRINEEPKPLSASELDSPV